MKSFDNPPDSYGVTAALPGTPACARLASPRSWQRPLVSVVIPVHDRREYIGSAIGSVLAQSLSNFEIVVVDDGSTDGTGEVVAAIHDERLRTGRHGERRGIPFARNSGLEHARGRYIAWLDSDDLARPGRLARQIEFLERHPAVAMLGACAGKIGASGERLRGHRVPPLDSPDIGAWLMFRSAFQQSSIVGRAAILRRFPYREELSVCEDVDVFQRLSGAHTVLNLPEVLIDRRIHAGQTIRREHQAITGHTQDLMGPRLHELGVHYSTDDLRRHIEVGAPGRLQPERDHLDWTENWLHRLRDANRGSHRLDNDALHLACGYFWTLACLASARHTGRVDSALRWARSRWLAGGLASGRGRRWLRQAAPVLAGATRGGGRQALPREARPAA